MGEIRTKPGIYNFNKHGGKNEKKQTVLGLYVTAKEAFAKWHVAPNKIKILDVRTQGEYIFVGHAPMAVNIPLKYLKSGVDLEKMKPALLLNKKFVDEVKNKFEKTDTIMIRELE